MLFETGHPWITFKDPCNLRSPQQHYRRRAFVQSVHRNHTQYIEPRDRRLQSWVREPGKPRYKAGIDRERLKRTISTGLRMLDNVININFYTVPRSTPLQPASSSCRTWGSWAIRTHCTCCDFHSHRKKPFASPTRAWKLVSFYAISASVDLAASAADIRHLKVRSGARAFCRSILIECFRNTQYGRH